MATPKPEPNPSGIVQVGDGRGFVVQGRHDRYVITAAHCLPHLPPATLGSFNEERTYRSLLGPLHGKCEIWAECLFADPLSDVAVLGAVDNQVYFDGQDEAYEETLEALPPFPIADVPGRGEAWLYSLDGRWFVAKVSRLPNRREFQLADAAEAIESGMSGSPIRLASGKAIGVVSTSIGSSDEDHREAWGIALTKALPVWLVRELRHPVQRCFRCGLDSWHRDHAECIQELGERIAMLEEGARAKATRGN